MLLGLTENLATFCLEGERDLPPGLGKFALSSSAASPFILEFITPELKHNPPWKEEEEEEKSPSAPSGRHSRRILII